MALKKADEDEPIIPYAEFWEQQLRQFRNGRNHNGIDINRQIRRYQKTEGRELGVYGASVSITRLSVEPGKVGIFSGVGDSLDKIQRTIISGHANQSFTVTPVPYQRERIKGFGDENEIDGLVISKEVLSSASENSLVLVRDTGWFTDLARIEDVFNFEDKEYYPNQRYFFDEPGKPMPVLDPSDIIQSIALPCYIVAEEAIIYNQNGILKKGNYVRDNHVSVDNLIAKINCVQQVRLMNLSPQYPQYLLGADFMGLTT
ncbi:MAG: hypothetical protein WCX69_03330 [Candidatus Paceibacterota bacterium]